MPKRYQKDAQRIPQISKIFPKNAQDHQLDFYFFIHLPNWNCPVHSGMLLRLRGDGPLHFGAKDKRKLLQLNQRSRKVSVQNTYAQHTLHHRDKSSQNKLKHHENWCCVCLFHCQCKNTCAQHHPDKGSQNKRSAIFSARMYLVPNIFVYK